MPSCVFHFTFQEIAQDTKDICLQIPWFARLLDEPSLSPIGPLPRHLDVGNLFMSQTLSTKETMPAYQSFYKSPSIVPPANGSLNLGEMQTFFCIGSGLSGHTGVCHGGVISTLLDNTMGILARCYPDTLPVTKYLHVDFKRSLHTPGAALCRARLTRIEGRKMWASSSLEDGQGNLYGTGEALFINRHSRL